MSSLDYLAAFPLELLEYFKKSYNKGNTRNSYMTLWLTRLLFLPTAFIECYLILRLTSSLT